MLRLTALLAPILLLAGCATPTVVDLDPAGLWKEAPVFSGSWAATALGGSPATSLSSWNDDDEDDEDGMGPVGFVWGLVMYIPNRVLDVFDMVRARVRLGPGFAIGARATEYADVFIGFYTSLYIGLPGPRGRSFPRLPVGLESKSGAEVSVADITLEAGMSPDYGMTECGAGFHLGLIGVDVGVDPFEIVDFVVGLFTFDPMDDDY